MPAALHNIIMRYSLLSRFQGTLLGANIGYRAGNGILAPAGPEPYPIDSQIETNNGISAQSSGEDAISVAVASAESLIEYGGLQREHWAQAIARVSTPADAKAQLATLGTAQAMATVPLALFFHDNEQLMRENIYQILEILSTPSEVKDGLLAVGYAIAQSLKEQLDPMTLIPQTIAYLPQSDTSLVQQLVQVQICLESGASLETATAKLIKGNFTTLQQASIPFALAFYCFLSTLENFHLAVVRSRVTEFEPQLTCSLTGALSAAYNSIPGIPLAWRMFPKLTQFDQSRKKQQITTEKGKNIADILQLAERLLAAWSGVYDLENRLAEASIFRVVTAPNIIRPR